MFKTNPVSLKELLDDTESGKIQLPDFQRGWVWDDDRIRGLLASISRGFPVGRDHDPGGRGRNPSEEQNDRRRRQERTVRPWTPFSSTVSRG